MSCIFYTVGLVFYQLKFRDRDGKIKRDRDFRDFRDRNWETQRDMEFRTSIRK